MKKFFVALIVGFFSFLVMMMGIVVVVDPFFQYHAPLKSLYYTIDNPRWQSRGIAKHFEYDSIITGSSLTQPFKTSEFDQLFGTDAIKLPFPGATFYETEQMLEGAFKTHDNIKYVFRSLDVNHLLDEREALRDDLGEYPYYLYNDILWDDYKYVCNEDIILSYCAPSIISFMRGEAGGHTSFDEYMKEDNGHGNWYYAEEPFDSSGITEVSMSEAEKEKLTENVTVNMVDLAKAHPDTTFIYYIPPYNIHHWLDYVKEGKVGYTCEEIQMVMELLLECENVKLYCFTNRTDITTDLNNYIDGYHYVQAVGSMILKWVANDEDLITRENYMQYVDEMKNFYSNYQYYVTGFEGMDE